MPESLVIQFCIVFASSVKRMSAIIKGCPLSTRPNTLLELVIYTDMYCIYTSIGY